MTVLIRTRTGVLWPLSLGYVARGTLVPPRLEAGALWGAEDRGALALLPWPGPASLGQLVFGVVR